MIGPFASAIAGPITRPITQAWAGGQSLESAIRALFAAGEQGAWYDPSDFERYMGELGPELSEDPDFDNTAKWVKDTGWSVTGGQAVHNGAAAGYIRTLFRPVVGKTYTFTIDIAEMPAGAVISVYCGESTSSRGFTVAGVYSFVLPALATTLNFAIRSSNATGLTSRINSFSIKEVTSISTATMFQDAAGTIPVTALEQSVGRILDKSGLGNHATQPTTASKPKLSARVNQFLNSEAQAGTFGGPTGGMTKVIGVVTPIGTTAVMRSNGGGGVSYAYTTSPPVGAGVLSVYARRIDQQPIVFASPNIAANPANNFAFVVNGVAVAPNQYTVEELSDGWYRVSLPTTYANNSIGVIQYTSGVAAEFTGIQWELTSALVPGRYQRVNTATDYDTVGFPRYLKFDGVDDVLTMYAATAPGTCTVVRSVPGVGAEITTGVSVGTSHNLTQNFHGLLIANRALTPLETANVTNWANDLAGVTP